MSFSERVMKALALTPGNVLPPNFWYWTFFTYPFLEAHIWNVIIDILVIFLYGNLVEPLWGAQEMLLFFVIVSVSVGICSTVYYFFAFLLLRSPSYLFEYQMYGLAGYVGAFSVAVKQTMPDHVIINSPFGKLRNRHVPSYVLLFAILARIIGIEPYTFPVMCGLGILTSWTYLRFYQRHSNGNKGDVAESFSLARYFNLIDILYISCDFNYAFILQLFPGSTTTSHRRRWQLPVPSARSNQGLQETAAHV